MVFVGCREIQAIAGFGFRTQSRRKRGLRGRASGMFGERPYLGEWPQNQAARIGQSRRAIRRYREIPAIARFGLRPPPRREAEIHRRFGNVRESAQPTREWREWPENPAARINSQSIRGAGNIGQRRRSPVSVAERILGAGARLIGGASGTHEGRRKRGASGANSPRIRRIGSTSVRLGCVPRLRPFRWS